MRQSPYACSGVRALCLLKHLLIAQDGLLRAARNDTNIHPSKLSGQPFLHHDEAYVTYLGADASFGFGGG